METWRAVAGFEGLYEVSDMGGVRSLDRYVNSKAGSLRRVRGRVLKTTYASPYLHVSLSKENNVTERTVHTLVAEAFIPNPKSKSEVHHKDELQTNNVANNLEWLTRAEHAARSGELGQLPFGSNNGAAKLTEEKVIKMRKLHKQGHSFRALAKRFGVAKYAAQSAVNGYTWRRAQAGQAILLEMIIILAIMALVAAALVPSLVSANQAKAEANVAATMQNIINAEQKSFTTNLSSLGVVDGDYKYSINGTASAYSVFAVPTTPAKGRLGFCGGNSVPATLGQVQQFPATPQNIENTNGPCATESQIATATAAIEGPAGPQGAAGAVGPPGTAGPAGAMGAVGVAGPQGTPGSNGAIGSQGAIGPAGPQGPQGVPGFTGAQGSVGATGPQGPAGATGLAGANGSPGVQGIQGLQGIPGNSATGSQGPQGIAGPAGTSAYGGVWNLAGTYTVGQMVMRPSVGGSVGPFFSLTGQTGTDPALDSTDWAYCCGTPIVGYATFSYTGSLPTSLAAGTATALENYTFNAADYITLANLTIANLVGTITGSSQSTNCYAYDGENGDDPSLTSGLLTPTCVSLGFSNAPAQCGALHTTNNPEPQWLYSCVTTPPTHGPTGNLNFSVSDNGVVVISGSCASGGVTISGPIIFNAGDTILVSISNPQSLPVSNLTGTWTLTPGTDAVQNRAVTPGKGFLGGIFGGKK